MSEDRKLTDPETEEERQMRAKVHRWMGMAATLLTLVAVGVAIYRLNVTLSQNQAEVGITLGESMKIMFSALPWVLLVIALGVLFSMGTTRIMLGLEKVVGWMKGKKVGK